MKFQTAMRAGSRRFYRHVGEFEPRDAKDPELALRNVLGVLNQDIWNCFAAALEEQPADGFVVGLTLRIHNLSELKPDFKLGELFPTDRSPQPEDRRQRKTWFNFKRRDVTLTARNRRPQPFLKQRR
jgi:hypothetical protein